MTTAARPGAGPPAALGRPGARRYRSTVISLAASALLLGLLYRRLDWREVGAALLGADPWWLMASVLVILPITVLRAARFLWVAPPASLSGLAEALRLTLVASALNLVAPGKTGDFVKGYAVAKQGDTSTGVSLAVVIYERLCDLFGLIFWCVLGWALARPDTEVLGSPFWLLLGVSGGACLVLVSSVRAAGLVRWLAARMTARGPLRSAAALVDGWPDLLALLGRRRFAIVAVSAGLWWTHLVQIWLFTVALSTPVPFLACASLTAVALMAGQMPFTLAGIGARDVALVALMGAYMPAESAAALGILIATRGLLPALLGLPFTWPYVSAMLIDVRRWRRRARSRRI